nr:Na/Pi symporter [Entomomonas asaccharolytica]
MLLIAGLLCSFYFSRSWVDLCAGLAFFLFGMQCMEDGLKQLAGGKLEQLLAKSTATPLRGLVFGIGSTMVLQSTTLVSLLTIAFISTGLITLAGGITIILGANLGATSGIWLLALAGQSISLSPFAYPLVVLGVLAAFNGDKSKALGRILLGIAFIFLGIDQIKGGFSTFTGDLDLAQYQFSGFLGALLFLGIGLIITVILQSSHATLMLTLTALGLGQIGLEQSFALAIGSNVGSAVTTGVMGFIGGNRSGQRLALAHVIFNVTTGLVTFMLLTPLTWTVASFADLLKLNPLIQLALFHTIFNVSGVVIFWFLQYKLANALIKWLPDIEEPKVLITEVSQPTTLDTVPVEEIITPARYLNDNALSSVETAITTVIKELEHLERISLEVICHALYIPVEQLSANQIDLVLLNSSPENRGIDADTLYRRHIKGIYSDLLTFMGRIEIPSDDEQHQQLFMTCQVVALQLVDAVKDAKHLQKNLHIYLDKSDSTAYTFYIELRKYLLGKLREIYKLGELDLPDELWFSRLQLLNDDSANFDTSFRNRLFASVRLHQLNGTQTSSLMNDVGYASRIVQSLRNVLILSHSSDNDIFNKFKQAVDEERSEHLIIM